MKRYFFICLCCIFLRVKLLQTFLQIWWHYFNFFDRSLSPLFYVLSLQFLIQKPTIFFKLSQSEKSLESWFLSLPPTISHVIIDSLHNFITQKNNRISHETFGTNPFPPKHEKEL